jgi:sacsin
MKPAAVSTPSADEDIWLTEFWKYWNSNIDSLLPSSNIGMLDAKIFRATHSRLNGTYLYASPREFNRLPAVVEPSSGEQKKLCDKIPGLWRFNPDLMPKSMADKERSFSYGASFYRLLSGQSGIGTFVKTHLDAASLKVSLDIPQYSHELLSGSENR